MKRIKCGKCGREQFETAKCVCGFTLTHSEEVGLAHEIESMDFYMPKPALDLIYLWFKDYYKSAEELPGEHVALAVRLGFIFEEDEDVIF